MNYTFEMTPERARASAEELDAVLWFQNERFYQHLQARMPWRTQLRVIAMALSVGGFLLALAGAVFAPHLRISFLFELTLLGIFFVVFHRIDALIRAMRAGTRKLVRRRVRRLMDRVIQKAPFPIEYRLEGGRLAVRAEALGISAELPLARVRFAIVSRTIVCPFDRPISQRPLRILYIPGTEGLDLLLAELEANGAEVVRL